MHRQVLQYDPTIGYRFIPDIRVRLPHEGGGYLFQTNPQGFRSPHDFSKPKSKDKFRLLVFGDSYTVGEGVSDGKRYTDLVEKSDARLEVFNFALPGTGSDQQFLIFQTFAKTLEADAVLLAPLVENIRRNRSHYRVWRDEATGNEMIYAKPYFKHSNQEIVLMNSPVPKHPLDVCAIPKEERNFIDQGGRFAFLRNAIIRMGLSEFAQKLSRYQPVPEYDSPEHHDWQLMRAIFMRWMGSIKVPVILFPLPLYAHIEGNATAHHYQNRFAELSKDSGAVLCDPLKFLQQFSPSERRDFRFRHDPHPTPKGHLALSQALIPVVKACLNG